MSLGNPEKAAFFGLGAMGAPIAERMAEQCEELIVADIIRENVERLCRHRRVCSAGADKSAQTVFLCLPDQAAVEDVVSKLSPSATRVIVDFGAHSPDFVKSHAELCRQQGMIYCDAPVFGTPSMASQGELYFLFSGPEPEYECFEILAANAGFRSRYAGPSGAASAVKLLQNALGTVNLLAAAETLRICEETGIDPEMFSGVVAECGGIGRSVVFEKFGSDLAARKDSGEGRLRIAAKDMAAAVNLADQSGVKAPLMRETAKRFQGALDADMGNDQFSNIIKEL